MQRKRYPSDLTDAPWQRRAPRIPPATPGGRPRRVDLRAVVTGRFDVPRAGVS